MSANEATLIGAANETEPVVATSHGRVRGVHGGDVYAFKGIPYAAPPVGPLRFRAPQPPQSWDGVRDATAFSRIAPQPVMEFVGSKPREMSEDCLTVNVYTPQLGDAGLPVMVWIHGGAYYVGSSADPLYDGSRLAAGGAVIVTFNYRIGPLGYLDLSSFSTAEDEFESNVGQKDQLAALAWVRDNIRAFGGSPDRVTLFGESSGAGAVTTMMATPSAEGLMHGAIAQSSPVGSVYTRETARRSAERFLQRLDVAPGDVHRLRRLPAAALIEACYRLIVDTSAAEPGTIPVAPVVDGELVPEYPLTAMMRGQALRIPLMIGSNRDEAMLFRLLRSPIVPNTSKAVQLMVERLGTPEALAVPSGYRGYPRLRPALRLSTDAAFRMPTVWAASAHSRYAPTWAYEFDFAPPLIRVAGLGAMHGAELAHVFDTHVPKIVAAGAVSAGRRLTSRMQARWLSFASIGDPNPVGMTPFWPHYDTERRSTYVFDSRDRVVRDPHGELRRVWGDDIIAFR
ncbi:MAG TPA: carboxylesterase/lipase family protein [Humibacter sp.]|nr:carboxylesterase/lipase family protein [Humibacter sp.]